MIKYYQGEEWKEMQLYPSKLQKTSATQELKEKENDRRLNTCHSYLKPLLPLRDIVIFPSMVVPLFVGREKSIKALQEVMKTDKSIVLVTQKNSEVDDPIGKDLYQYGCLSKVLQLLKLPDGTVKVLVEGEKRIKIFTNPITKHQNKFLMMNEGNFVEGVAMNTFGENFDFEGKTYNPKMKYQLLGTNLDYLINNKIYTK